MPNKNIVRQLAFLTAFSTITILCSCTGNKYTSEINSILDKAGENRAQLENVITHYQTEGDSLKLNAALYLIANMEGHSYVTYYLHDSSGAEIEFEVTDYADYDELTTATDSIEAERGLIDYAKREAIEDIHTITADYLIAQIDLSFRAWREKEWAKNLSFDQFKEFVLPYRGSNEPLEPWREQFLDKYQSITDNMTNLSDPIEAAVLINDDIRSWFGFDPRWYYHPTDQGLTEMLQTGLGRCEDMTNITIYAMRANGIAVTSDYTPYWANTGNNHAWNAILLPDGSVVPFMGAEANPGEYRINHGAAKVYRKTFAQQKDNLVFQERKQEAIPRWLKRRSYRDVTAEYVPTMDITVTLSKPVPDSVDIAYICVFNSGKWKPIDWARVDKGDVAFFTDLGTGLTYMPALYLNETVVPYGPPFAILGDFATQEFAPSDSLTVTARLTSTTKRNQKRSEEGIEKTFLTVGTEYELFYFDNGWHSIGKATATDKPLVFDNVPLNALCWLVAEGTDHEERIFSLQNGKQVWW